MDSLFQMTILLFCTQGNGATWSGTREYQQNVFWWLEDSWSVWEDVECKLRGVNFRRVSNPTSAFLPAFKVTGIPDNCYRSTMGVIVIGLWTLQSNGENLECTWERLGAPVINLGVPATSLGAPATSLGVYRITVQQSTKNNIFLGKTACVPRNHSYYRSFNDFKTHVFSLYSHLCI